MAFYWNQCLDKKEGTILDIDGDLVLIEDHESGCCFWIDAKDVDPDSIYEWYWDNGRVGVGAWHTL